MHLDETIMQTKTVTNIVGVLRKVVIDMNPLLKTTVQFYDIIRAHEVAKLKQNVNRTKFNNYE